jgi:hypothetical protein
MAAATYNNAMVGNCPVTQAIIAAAEHAHRYGDHQTESELRAILEQVAPDNRRDN